MNNLNQATEKEDVLAEQGDKKKILVVSSIPEKGVAELRRNYSVDYQPKIVQAEVSEAIRDFNALIVRSNIKVTEDVINNGNALEIIGRAGAGLDNIDVPAAKRRDIRVFNTPKGNSNAVAEMVFTMMLTLSRNLIQADKSMKEGKWEKDKLKGQEVEGKTLGIIGIGNIGTRVAKFASAFDMNVIGYDPYYKGNGDNTSEIKQVSDLEALLKDSDFVTIHVPKNAETTNMIGFDQLKKMKKNAILINASRGGIVNEKDLQGVLDERMIAGAGIDTWENEPNSSELSKMPNVIATPHIGASTKEAQDKCVFDLISQINHYYQKYIQLA